MMIDNPRKTCQPDGMGTSAAALASCASIPGKTWHCVYTKPLHEVDADGALTARGFETLLPLYEHVRADRSRVVRVLFPRYTFVRLDVERDPWRRVVRSLAHSEVGQIMCNTVGRPLVIPDAVISALVAQAGPDRIIRPPPTREMRRGDAGRVLQGPLSDFHGICSRTSRDRVWLLLSIMGRQSEVGFDRKAVEIQSTSA